MERKGVITFKYFQLVKEVTHEPDYEEVLAKAGSMVS
jgi:hypothetical protein